ncbi:MAG: nitroreductase [Candidatus Lambdaproteobacteria bacterium]|nr:nitroreductase [Candidatus Lambdaproteobacteria bacterium]
MDALECLFTRRTALALVGPEPTAEQLDVILRAAAAAPDHRHLHPWRFVIVRGEQRKRLGEALRLAAAVRDPHLAPDVLERAAAKATRAPMVLAVIASPRESNTTPRWEQLASAAAATQNICLAAHAQGLGVGWKSTHLGDSAEVQRAFAMSAGEELLALIEIGHAAPEIKPKPRTALDLSAVVSEFGGDALTPYSPPNGNGKSAGHTG